MPIVGLADGAIETLVVDVIDAPRAAPARVRRGKSPVRQVLEEIARVLAKDDVCEGRVLPRHADTGMQHDRRQEGGLAWREAIRGDRRGPVGEGHRSTFSAVCGSNGDPPRRPLAGA